MKYSVVIPVYKNETSIPRLIDTLIDMNKKLHNKMEVVFVVDGSPDKSYELLQEAIKKLEFPAQLLAHSRNFGSFPAIRTGLQAARGQYFGVMAADLQEPPELIIGFFHALEKNECDVAIGTRINRKDKFLSRLSSNIFWGLYRRLIIKDMPKGGVDIFGCNRQFCNQLLRLEESRSSLIALIFWLGFRRKLVGYERQERQEGKSAWTLSKKIDYMMDSIFAFTDYPIRLLMRIGFIGTLISSLLALVVLFARLSNTFAVPGYAATILAILALGAFNLLGLGLVGTYAWRAYENSKQRPLSIISIRSDNNQFINKENQIELHSPLI